MRKTVFQCVKKYTKPGKGWRCHTPHLIIEDEMKGLYLSAMRKLLEDKQKTIMQLKTLINDLADTSGLAAKLVQATAEREAATEAYPAGKQRIFAGVGASF